MKPPRGRAGFWPCLLASLFFPWLIVGCGSSAGAFNNDLRLPLIGVSAARGVLDPALANSTTPLYAASLLHAGLVKLGPDLHVIPDLAVSLPTISNRGRTYTFTVREDARFEDGTPCTAADVANSFARALRVSGKGSLARSFLGEIAGAPAVETGSARAISGIKVVHRLTVRIRLSRPDSEFLDKLAFPVASIVESNSSLRTPAGLGPFRFAGREADGSLSFVPRRHYYAGDVQFREIRLVPMAEGTQALAAYRAGSLDLAPVPFSQFRSMSSRSDFSQSEGLDAYYAIPRDDRSSLAATLDRTRLADTLGPATSALESFVPPAVPDYQPSLPAFSSGSRASVHVRTQASQTGDGIQAVQAVLDAQWTAPHGPTPIVTVIHEWHILPVPGRWFQALSTPMHSRWYRSVTNLAGRMTNDPVGRLGLYDRLESWGLSTGRVIPLVSGMQGFLIKQNVTGLEVTPEGPMPENDDWTQVGLSNQS